MSYEDIRDRTEKAKRYKPGNGAGKDKSEGSPRDPSAWPVASLDWAHMANLSVPRRSWFHDRWLSPVPTLLSGAAGSGKTLLMQQWAACLCLGKRFMAPFVFERPLVVLMWACEDESDELWRRQVAVCEWLGIGLAELANRFYLVPRLGKENTLLEPHQGSLQRTSIYGELREEVNDVRADVLIMDNTAQTFGGNENARHDVTVFSNMMAGLVEGRFFCPVTLGHTGKGEKSEYSGTTAWEAAVRMRLYFGGQLPDADPMSLLDNAPDEDTRFLAKRKANYTPKDYRRFTYRNGVFVPEETESGAEGGMVEVIRRRNAENAVLKAIPWLTERRLYASQHGQAHRFLPKLMQQHDLLNGVTKREATRAMTKLIGEKRVLVDQPMGVDAQRHRVLGLALAPESA
jgi:AAA domain-containing protein